jgi:CheY-like chemotaxis protein
LLAKPLFPSVISEIITECVGVDAEHIKETQADIQGMFEGRRILLVEDVDINREIVLTLLEPTRLEIDCAENGEEAVRMFSEAPGRYGLIFMDVQMPVMDGFEATRRIRAVEAGPRGVDGDETRGNAGASFARIPIIAMTANAFKEDIARCLDAGMDGHVGKPIDFGEVLEKMKSCLPSA